MALDYSNKPAGYFGGARKPFIDILPPNFEARLLEIGAGNGDTAAYARATGKCGWCCGVELCEEPGLEAAKKLDRVLIGDAEKIEFDFPPAHFDILIFSEVLEHLVDPWGLLRRLRPLMKPGAIVVAGSPNVAHYSVLFALLRGEWRYEGKGMFDATHLRWFTPKSYRAMFEDCGFIVDEVGPSFPIRPKPRVLDILTAGRVRYLFHPQIYLRGHCSP